MDSDRQRLWLSLGLGALVALAFVLGLSILNDETRRLQSQADRLVAKIQTDQASLARLQPAAGAGASSGASWPELALWPAQLSPATILRRFMAGAEVRGLKLRSTQTLRQDEAGGLFRVTAEMAAADWQPLWEHWYQALPRFVIRAWDLTAQEDGTRVLTLDVEYLRSRP